MKTLSVNPKNKTAEILTDENRIQYLNKQQLNLNIQFDKEIIIGLIEVKEFLALYKDMLDVHKDKSVRESVWGNLNFNLYNRVKNFDLTFIAALNLFKFSFPNISIRLIFDRLAKGSEAEACFFRFGQFCTASFIAYGHQIFSIFHDRSRVEPNFFLKTLSGYLPFVYVNKNSFEILFQKPIKESWEQWWQDLQPEAFKGLQGKGNRTEKIYQELRNHVIQRINFKGKPEQNILNFNIIYLFNAVRKFHFIKKILRDRFQRDKFRGAGIQVGDAVSSLGIGLSRESDREYEARVQHVFDRILEKPPAFVMLFSYFIEKFYSPAPGKDITYREKIKIRVELISNIFYFTEEIFYGVRELAKNIIEHSSNGRGIIVGRVLDREYLSQLKKGMHVESFLTTRPADDKEYIDFIVLDDGSRGIIEQTIENLKALEDEFKEIPDILGKFAEDIENLSKGKITLPDFFNPEEIKLKYQEVRSALSLGLLVFSHLVLKNSGYMMVSSPHGNSVQGMALFDNWQERRDLREIIPLGTFYNILIPKKLERFPEPRSETVPFEMPSGESAFNTLLKKVIECRGDEKIDETSNYYGGADREDKLCFIEHTLELEFKKEDIDCIVDMFRNCENCSLEKNQKILSLDFMRIIKLDPSDLFRFLAGIQMTKDIKSIIVHNVKEEIVFRIVEFFKIFRKRDLKIGSRDHFVLFYYQPSGQSDNYYTFLLGGESWEDIHWINEKIAKTNYTQPVLQRHEKDKKPSPEFQKDYCGNALFTGEGHLLPFDVLIRRNGLTLFEKNVFANLHNPGMHLSSPSCTFHDAHMRLGSKLHLRDFFYARRIFQNSFYSLRFAYLVCRYIRENIGKWIDKTGPGNVALTILGYGLYSELLISNVSRFLESTHQNWKINHAVIDDVEELTVLGKLERDVIAIIPMSSTLSTSHKIELRLKKSSCRIIGNPVNIMIVGNGEIKDIIDETGKVVDPIAKKFWEHLDEREKVITTRSPGKREKFFLYLPSKWYQPGDCELCFPEIPSQECVLFETDKVSVTPALIFDLPLPKDQTPLAKKIHFGEPDTRDKGQGKAVITEDMLLYDHTTRGNNHYLYYVESTDFLKRNESLLKDWLLEVKDELKKVPDIFDSKVILIAPTHFTNADFINLVNETIFNDVATLFHYDQDEDYIQNLKSFFGQDITRDAYVFFIDDAMCGGSTFEKLNNFVKYARSSDNSRGVDGAFVLINRLMQDKYSVLIKELERAGFFAFIDLDVPIMIDSEKFCHLCSEKGRYEKMLSETLLDSLRILIKNKIIKLKGKKYEERETFSENGHETAEFKYIAKEKCNFADPDNQENYLKRLEYVHKLYRAFSDVDVKDRIEKILRGYDRLEALCKEVGIAHSPQMAGLPKLSLDEKVDLIKVLSNPYFLYHKEIRRYIFRIVIMEFERTVESLHKIHENKICRDDMPTYRYLKFLIKRAARLKANYIIREQVFKQVFSLHHTLRSRLQGEEKDEQGRDMFSFSAKQKRQFMENLDGFVDYYLMAVKEITWFNEAKSLKLEETLRSMAPDGGTLDETFSLFICSLKIENISIPYRFISSLEKQLRAVILSYNEQNYNRDIDLLAEIVITKSLDDPYRSAPLLSFLGFEKDKEGGENESRDVQLFLQKNPTFNSKILPTILLKVFFLFKKRKEEEKSRVKPEMDYILYCLCKILDIELDSGGALFVVKYMKTSDQLSGANLFSIGHIGKNKEIESFNWDKSFTLKMLDGYTPSFKFLPLTYIQIVKRGKDYYTHYGEQVNPADISEIAHLQDMKSFLFLRIADEDLNSTARGVFVFYSKRPILIKPEHLRYALILKNDIFEFIEKNYESYSFKLYEEKIHQLTGLEALNSVISTITSAADLNEVYEAIEKTKKTFSNIDEMCLLTRKDCEYEAVIKCHDEGSTGCENCKPQKLQCVVKQGGGFESYYCPDVENDRLLKNTDNKGLKTKFIIPLVFKQELLGILDIGSKTKEAFSPFERKLLIGLGSQAAIAINNRIKQEKQLEIFKDTSHSLGTFLATMRSYSQQLVEGKVKGGSKNQKYLKMLFGDVLSFINVVDEISSLANTEYWDNTVMSDRVEIMEILKELAAKNKFLFKEKELGLNIIEADNKVYVKSNKQKLEEAIQSLLNNAIKFSDKNKSITVRISTAKNNVLIEIKDQGYGIHEEDLERIFEKYERGKNAKEKMVTGTGIGLAAARNIIEKHSGTIRVESKLGKGSIFTIELPRAATGCEEWD
ncbi:ATP-binding protein [Acidobacteriota bacterium]